ncbi:hypothetical protein F8E02_09040 [Methanoculleus sp. Wushi-C6]|uniref:Glycosyltransferase RgtA/B/C/D-like domain-containing protein n=1 Tax=Methanoculleus caldifontis TaxID=2651577 RepID=A0ABU3X264_9EURY|nr:hypothetical protein [Methanoculleus sp. Wushi-C6]MDV2482139.1 hypothetical protein [Methanoculleus sp. Wushi-C6]
MRLKDSVILRDPDKALAVVGVILSLILIAYLGKEFGRVIYLLTGVLALVSCLLWLAIRKSHTFEAHPPESRNRITFCATCFFGLYTSSVLSVYLRPEFYERPLLYFVLTALMTGIVACEIFTSGRRHTCLIFSQILLLGVSIAWSQLLIFPSLLGVDPWYHSAFTSWIIEGGVIPEGYEYSKLPLFHLTIAVNSLIADLPYKFAAMMSVSLAQIICNTVFILLIANNLFKNHRIGLLAALMTVIASHHIIMSYWSIPNAFAAIFIPISLYLLLFRHEGYSCSGYAVLLVTALTPIILTHTITAMCMSILLFVTWGALTFYRLCGLEIQNHVSLSIPIGFTIAMFVWWTFVSNSIWTLIDLIESGFSTDFFAATPGEVRGYSAIIPLGEQFFNTSGLLLFFAFSFIGIFYMISRRGSSSSFTMAWVGVTPLAIGFFSLISNHTVIEHRWWYFAQILTSIPLAIAIYTVGTWKLKKHLSLYSLTIGFVVVLSLLMIISPPANIDNLLLFPNCHMRYSPTEAELKSMTTIMDKWDGSIKTDEYFAGTQKFQHRQVSAFSQQLYAGDYPGLKNHLIVTRKATIRKPFWFLGGIYTLDYDLNVKLETRGFSRIYDSGSGSGYQTW